MCVIDRRHSLLALSRGALLVAIGVFTAGAVRGATQQAPPSSSEPFLETVAVPRVLVDLVVWTRGGEPVLDLDAGEVRVFDDGEPVEILGFSRPEIEAGGEERTKPRRREERPPSVARRPHTVVVFLDELHLRLPNKKKILKAVRDTVGEAVAAGAEVAITAYDGNLRMIQPLTRDLGALRSALDAEMRNRALPAMAMMADPQQAMVLIQDRMRDNTQDRPAAGGLAARPDGNDPCVDTGGLARTHAEQAASAVNSSLRGLAQLVATMEPFAGRKSLLYVSDGIPLVPGLEVYTYAIEMCDGTAARAGIANAVDTQDFGSGRNTRWDPRKARTDLLDFDTTAQWRQVAAFANSLQVSIYPIQATGLQGLRSGGVQDLRTTGSLALMADANLRDSLTLVAEQTGGEAIFDTNRLGDGMRHLLADADRVYELSFEPRHPGDGKTHTIRVEVDRPGVEIRHRRSYRALPAAARMESAVVAALFHGPAANPLDARMLTELGEDGDDGRHRVTVKLYVPLSKLTMIPRAGDERGRFTVALGGKQANGRYLEIGHKTIDVSASDVERSTRAFLYEVEVPFRSPGVTLAAVVRDDLGGEIATVRSRVQVRSAQ